MPVYDVTALQEFVEVKKIESLVGVVCVEADDCDQAREVVRTLHRQGKLTLQPISWHVVSTDDEDDFEEADKSLIDAGPRLSDAFQVQESTKATARPGGQVLLRARDILKKPPFEEAEQKKALTILGQLLNCRTPQGLGEVAKEAYALLKGLDRLPPNTEEP